ncbi:MAG: hypothetical protein IKO20_08750 [Bacteroidaceae bacterium]|nr:hypothetical protein [Bacteroidaceae bacterium]
MKNIKRTRVGSEEQYGPRLAGEILHDYQENSNEPLAVAYRERSEETEEHGWHTNTELACDVKTLLRSDKRMLVNKEYPGVFRLDSEAEIDDFRCRDAHMTFIETVSMRAEKRNPHVFVGRYITITRRDDGLLRPNFKPMPVGMSADNYALGVYRELREALGSLVEQM